MKDSMKDASSFENLLEKDGSVSIYNRNLQVLVTEMFKISSSISSSIIKGIFESRTEHTYNLLCISQLSVQLVCTVFHDTEGISSLAPKISLNRLRSGNPKTVLVGYARSI